MLNMPFFSDRTEAGDRLAELVVAKLSNLDDSEKDLPRVVFALPRGGLPVAVPVARRLRCPLDIIVAKKIARPENPELAIGACTASGDVVWSDHRSANQLSSELRQMMLHHALHKAQNQLTQLAPASPHIDPRGVLAIIIDDGIATGMTMLAALQGLRQQQAAAVWVAAPVSPPELIPCLQELSDQVLLLGTPDPFLSVSRFYGDFPQVQMAEALRCLQEQKSWLANA